MPHIDIPVASPLVVLREEFDDWAILFNPDDGDAFGLSPTGVCIWKMLDGIYKKEDIIRKIRESFSNVPEEAEAHLDSYLQALVEKGLAGYKIEEGTLS